MIESLRAVKVEPCKLFFCGTPELLAPKMSWQGLGMVSGGFSEVLPTLSRTVSVLGFYDADL